MTYENGRLPGDDMADRLAFEHLAMTTAEARLTALAAQLAVKMARAEFVQSLDTLAEMMISSGQAYSFKAWPDRMLIDSDRPELGYVPVYASNDSGRVPYYFEGVKVLEVMSKELGGPNLFIEPANYTQKFIVPLRTVEELRLMPLPDAVQIDAPAV